MDSNKSLNDNRKIKKIKKDHKIELIRNVFERAQFIKNTQSCLNEFNYFLINYEFNEFYQEFCRDLKCTLKYEHDNSNVKNILNIISSFLLSLKFNYSDLNLKKRKNNFDKELAINSKKSKSKFNDNENNVPIDEISSLINDENDQLNIISKNSNPHSINKSTLNSKSINSSTRLTRSKTNKLKDSTNNLKNFKESSTIRSVNRSNNESSTKSIYKIYYNLLEFIISDVLIPLLLSNEENTRLNCCFLLNKLINSIDDLETNLFSRLKSSILERLIDKNPKVRAAAVLLLYRFQDKSPINSKFNNLIDVSTNDNSLNQKRENQDVEDGLIFHLKYDPSPLVRLNCLNVIIVNDNTLPIILTKLRDINNGIREKTFIKLSKKINFKQLDQNDKLFIIKNGLNDRKENVLNAFKINCIPSIIKSYNNNLIDLITDLNLDCNHQLINQFLINYFDTIYSKDKIIFNKFHRLIIDFCKEYLDDEFLIKRENHNFETFYLWINLINYLKKKEFELDKQIILNKIAVNELRFQLKNQFTSILNNFESNEQDEYTSLKDKSNSRLLNYNCNLLNDKNESDFEYDVPINSNKLKNINYNYNDNILNEIDSEQFIDVNNNNSEIIGLSKTVNIPPIHKNRQLINNNQTINLPIINNEDQNQLDDNDYSLVDLIIPKFTKFIQFFRLFCYQLNDKNYENDKEILIDQLLFEQLISFLKNYEINDDYQKTLILELIDDNLVNLDNNVDNLDNYIDELLNYLHQNVLKNEKEFFEYSFELQNKMELIVDIEEVEKTFIEIKLDDIRKLEVMNANKMLKIHELKDQLDDVIAKCEYDKAHKIQKEIESIKEECNQLNEKINQINEKFNNQNHENKDDNDDDDIQKLKLLLIENPIQHFKLIKLFQLTTKFCSPNRINSIVDAKLHKYVLSGILSEDSKFRYEAIKTLNELCFINLKIANKYYPLYKGICLKDNEKIQALAFEGLIDFVLEHGLDVLYDLNSSHDNNDGDKIYTKILDNLIKPKNNNEISSNLETSNSAFNFSEHQQQFNIPRISINLETSSDTTNKQIDVDDDLINKSHFIEPTIINPDQIELNKQITKKFVKFILNFVKSSSELIKSISVMGICKLAFMRIYSPKLLSELILLWYNSSTSQSIIQDIGSFLPIYCLTESTFHIELPSHLNGQNCLLECFMSTVESFYRLERGAQLNSSFDIAYSNYYDNDIDVLNVIQFMLNLLEPINHGKIMLEFCEKILEIINLERDDEYELKEPFISKYLIPSLNSFKLSNITDEQLDNLKKLMQNIRSSPRFNYLRKRLITKLVKFDNKLQFI